MEIKNLCAVKVGNVDGIFVLTFLEEKCGWGSISADAEVLMKFKMNGVL